ncbi:hypothetical protein BDF22DRAFT_773988 [Syncephalis plumigaleata]|nr:hypothetical protein BDF22DRAFT_773988 [Syncephalis plumigaleata]
MSWQTPTRAKSNQSANGTPTPLDTVATPTTPEPLDSILPTPRILRLASDELRERLRVAYQQLRENNANLQLAAELASLRATSGIGATVKEQQQQQQPPSADINDQHYEKRTGEEEEEEELALQQDMHKRALERVEELAQVVFELENAQSDLTLQLERAHNSAREQEERNTREQSRLREELEKTRKTLATAQTQLIELADDKREQLVNEREERHQVHRQLDEVSTLLKESEARHHEQEQWKQRCHEKEQQLETMETELRLCKDQLNLLTPAPSDTLNEGVTLFTQVDDRRKQLEQNHQKLKEDHRGLKRSHDVILQQQGRMRSHITRLTQLAHTADQEERVRRLEQALGQSQSENQQLQAKVTRLERQPRLHHPVNRSTSSDDTTTTSMHSTMADNELIHWLQLRVNQLSDETEMARHELRTVRLLQQAESDKVQKITMQLNEISVQRQQAMAENTRLQLIMEEINLCSQRWKQHATSFTDLDDDTKAEAYTTLISIVKRLQQSLSSSSSSIVERDAITNHNTTSSTSSQAVKHVKETTNSPIKPSSSSPSSPRNPPSVTISNDSPVPPSPKRIRVTRNQLRSNRQQECNQQ